MLNLIFIFFYKIIKHYLIDMVLGIEYLHMKNVIHKDLKPCNILICQNERLKIADFGVSKITAMQVIFYYFCWLDFFDSSD